MQPQSLTFITRPSVWYVFYDIWSTTVSFAGYQYWVSEMPSRYDIFAVSLSPDENTPCPCAVRAAVSARRVQTVETPWTSVKISRHFEPGTESHRDESKWDEWRINLMSMMLNCQGIFDIFIHDIAMAKHDKYNVTRKHGIIPLHIMQRGVKFTCMLSDATAG